MQIDREIPEVAGDDQLSFDLRGGPGSLVEVVGEDLAVRRPAPSAMFDSTETTARRNWLVKPNRWSRGNSRDTG